MKDKIDIDRLQSSQRKVAVIHTSFVSVDDLKSLFAEIIPEVEMVNIVDDSLLREVLAAGSLTTGVVRRICSHAIEAESMGSDLILNQCSSVGEAVDIARKMVNIPFIKIDEPMAEEAAQIGGNVAIIATVPTTLGPSSRLIRQKAAEIGKDVNVKECLAEGAFDVLIKEGNKEKHNQIVLEKIYSEAKDADVIVLAQGSMICLLPHLSEIEKPVLTSPRSGVIRVRKLLGLDPSQQQFYKK
jgi:Asp/Glu/hydantoin racemase